MALYDYKCDACERVATVEHPMGAAGPTTCSCGGGFRKLFSVGGVSFKGAGFYSNDSRTAPLF
jgi:putative FmdB family regulatory protein